MGSLNIPIEIQDENQEISINKFMDLAVRKQAEIFRGFSKEQKEYVLDEMDKVDESATDALEEEVKKLAKELQSRQTELQLRQEVLQERIELLSMASEKLKGCETRKEAAQQKIQRGEAMIKEGEAMKVAAYKKFATTVHAALSTPSNGNKNSQNRTTVKMKG